VSREIYHDYISQGPGRPRPNAFRPVRVAAKKQEYLAYLYIPRFDVQDLAELDPYTPEAGTEGGAPRPADSLPAAHGTATNIAYRGDAFSGDKFKGDKNIY
jgi:hypothetical protein